MSSGNFSKFRMQKIKFTAKTYFILLDSVVTFTILGRLYLFIHTLFSRVGLKISNVQDMN